VTAGRVAIREVLSRSSLTSPASGGAFPWRYSLIKALDSRRIAVRRCRAFTLMASRRRAALRHAIGPEVEPNQLLLPLIPKFGSLAIGAGHKLGPGGTRGVQPLADPSGDQGAAAGEMRNGEALIRAPGCSPRTFTKPMYLGRP